MSVIEMADALSIKEIKNKFGYHTVFGDTTRHIFLLAVVNETMFHIDLQGNPIYTERFDDIGFFIEDVADVMLNGKGFHINKDGKPIYEERYDQVCSFGEGAAVVLLNEKQFHIGKDGKPLYEERYDCAMTFKNGVSLVALGDEKIYIDIDGHRLVCDKIPFVGSREDTLHIIHSKSGLVFSTGCFRGTLSEFESAVKKTHADESDAYIEYMDIIDKYKKEGLCNE